MTQSFVHLHCHSEFSLLDGMSRIGDLVQTATDAGMPALALTDHGTMFGAIEFYSKAREKGVKPIIGCEVYVADRPLDEKADSRAQNYHLVLLAENEEGYRNLIRLTTEAHLRGFYRKPRIDHALLERHSAGLICLSACANGELARIIQAGDLPAAEEKADWYHQVFGDRYYLELQYHELDFQPTINQGILHLSQKLNLPLVATNDVHYVRSAHAGAHDVLLCIQTQTTMSDPKRMRLGTQQFYLKSPDEMRALFEGYPGAISNTLAIAERCNLDIAFGRPQLPHFEAPTGQSPREYLRSLCEEGVRSRYAAVTDEIRERLEYELSVIVDTGFVDYYLVVHDVIWFARGAGIAVGPGRGSAAGSIVAYVLYLTNVDPIAHGLSFERFLNPARVTMPDMDLDFADDRREEVIQYVAQKYGRERVAQIITFGTLGARAGVRDVGRALGMSYPDVDRVAKLVPFMCSKIAKAKEEAAELQQLYDGDPAMRRLLDTVEDLEGVARHASTHAAGVVISRDPLTEHVPLYKVPKNGQVTTQYAMGSIEQIGLLKLDFLGLRTLTILERARSFVRQSAGEDFKLDDIPLDDPRIYELLSTGETFGIFQVDGNGMRRLLRDLKPSEFNHIVALVALYRPGPMEHIDEFVARKNGLREVRYIHPALEEVLRETYGIVVYQDQVMRLAVRIAGYTMGEADLLRRAMGKKKPEELAKHRDTFIERAAKLGTDAKTARKLFDIVEPFAGYAFNKAHAAAYAVITCQTAFFKAVYPREYMAGYLSAEKDNAEKVADAMAECRRLGITILGPDINLSRTDFSLEDGGIRFGLSAVKHVGSGAIESILTVREQGGRFSSLEEFCSRIDWRVVNKRMLETLIRCGALDSFGIERGRLLGSLDRIVGFGTRLQRAAAAGQTTLFGDVEEPVDMLQLAVCEAVPLETRLAWEQELLGTYISPHPLAEAEKKLADAHAISVGDVTSDQHGKRIAVLGMVNAVRSFSTKQGKPMCSFQLSGLRSNLEVLVFSRHYQKLQGKLEEHAIVVVEGKFDAEEGRLRLLADAIELLEDVLSGAVPVNGNGRAGPQSSPNGNGHGSAGSMSEPSSAEAAGSAAWKITIEVERGSDKAHDIARILQVYQTLQRYRGQDEVEILVRQGASVRTIPLPNRNVGFCEQLKSELESLLAENSWRAQPIVPPA